MTTTPVLTNWHPASWHSRPAAQQPKYADPLALERAVASLSRLPPLVVSWEIEALRPSWPGSARRAVPSTGWRLRRKLRGLRIGQYRQAFEDLLQMSLVLLQGLKKPIIRVGRFAGQYAKPRSADTETRDGLTLPSYRGDNVNRPGFTVAEREPDPALLLRGYERASLTLDCVRALITAGLPICITRNTGTWDFSATHRCAMPIKRSSIRLPSRWISSNP